MKIITGLLSLIIILLVSSIQDGITQNAQYYYERAVNLKEQKKCSEAIPFFRSAIRLNPFFAEAHHDLAHCYETQKDWRGAEQEFRRSLELSPDNTRYRNCLAAFYHLYALDLLSQHHYESARYYSIESLHVLPTASAFHDLGHTYQALKDYKQSEIAFSDAIKQDPANSHHNFCRGNLYYDTQQFEKAFLDFSVVVSNNKRSANEDEHQSYFHLGMILLNERQDSQSAVNMFEKALSSCKNCELKERYNAQYISTREIVEKQQQHSLDAKQQKYVQSLYQKALALIEVGRYEKAMPLLEEAISLRPDDVQCRSTYDQALRTVNEKKRLASELKLKQYIYYYWTMTAPYLYGLLIALIMCGIFYLLRYKVLLEYFEQRKITHLAQRIMKEEIRKAENTLSRDEAIALREKVAQLVKESSATTKFHDLLKRQEEWHSIIQFMVCDFAKSKEKTDGKSQR